MANLIGLLGVAGLLSAYLLLQSGRLRAEAPSYSLLNALGSGGILFSLIYDFNLSAALIEGLWLVISLYGLIRGFRRRSSGQWSGARLPPET